MINKNIFREYDVRGIADTDLSDEFAELLGQAFGSRIRQENGKTVVMGRDVRESSPRLAAALARGMSRAGLDVTDLGIIPTPGVYYAVAILEADGGVVVTGSHNPIEYNGFKMQVGRASLHGDEIRALLTRIETKDFVEGTGTVSARSIQNEYEQMIVQKCRPARALKVVLDAGNGVAGPTALSVFTKLGHDVTALYCEPDGRFPNHQPDPTVEAYMEDLKAKVLEVGADLGCGYDGDGDRIGIVDGKGRLLYGDQLLGLFTREVLERKPGSKVVFDVKCSQGLEEDIRAHGGEPIMWKTGHSLTKAKMKEEGAPLAGEMSGHMFFVDDFYGHDDAVYASARFVAAQSRSGKSVADQVDSMPQYLNSPELRIECPDDRKFDIVEKLQAHFRKNHEVSEIDGARVLFEDGWGLVRASNTQPALALRFEARTEAGLAAVEAAFREALAPYPEVLW